MNRVFCTRYLPLGGPDAALAARYSVVLWNQAAGVLTMYGGIIPGGNGPSGSPPAIVVEASTTGIS